MTLAKPVSFPSVHPAPPHNRVRPVLSRPASVASSDPSDRERLLAEARQLQEKARLSALDGDLATSAQLILQALDCERRSGGLGPQVLQLIKPR